MRAPRLLKLTPGAGGHSRAVRWLVAAAASLPRRWPLLVSSLLPLLATGGLVLTLQLGGCASSGGYPPAPPGYYRIRSGDTLSEIAVRRRISMRQLATWNGLAPPYPIYAGTLLRIKPPDGRAAPAGERTAATAARRGAPTPPARGARSRGKASASAGPVKTVSRPAGVPGSAAGSSGITWQWPASGPLKQRYQAGERTRQGIRIGTAPGAPVLAAADGAVVYGGSGLKGYGNLIIVRHSPRYLSAYGFNRQLLVNEGDRVRRGQRLAEAGAAADGQPMLHFEIRRDGATVDPLLYLPAAR